ncbi:MAG: sigma-70 family RNA polymerase sigma factor [Chloroflexota bacterium]
MTTIQVGTDVGNKVAQTLAMNMNDEQHLVSLAQKGDMSAFGQLVDQHSLYVYNLALRLVKQPEEAEDMAQEAFLKAWRGLGTFRADAKFSTWLYRIVTNVCYNRLPRLQRDLANLPIDEGAMSMPDNEQNVDDSYLLLERNANLHQAIEELPDSYQLLISLRHLQEMSYNEIADVTDMPLGTVKTGIFRARKLLRETIQHYEHV